MKNSKIVASLALGSVITLTGCANNPFEAKTMENGHHDINKNMEGSCSNKNMEGSCSDKKGEGSCAAMKKDNEGKCSEGKCGS